MGLIGSGELAQMAADLVEVRDDNGESIVIRRGDSTLSAQTVRIARLGSQGRAQEGQATQQSEGRVVVLGSTTLDIQPGDRFNDANGALYQVVLVRPNRTAAVVAEATLVE